MYKLTRTCQQLVDTTDSSLFSEFSPSLAQHTTDSPLFSEISQSLAQLFSTNYASVILSLLSLSIYMLSESVSTHGKELS